MDVIQGSKLNSVPFMYEAIINEVNESEEWPGLTDGRQDVASAIEGTQAPWRWPISLFNYYG